MLSASGNNFKTPLALGLGAALAYRLRCSTSNARSKPPVAKKKPHHVPFGTVEGEDRGADAMPYQLSMVDDYFWMRDDSRKDPEVIGHLRAENEYAAGQMAHLAGLRTAVYDEMKRRLAEHLTPEKVRKNGEKYGTVRQREVLAALPEVTA